MRQGDHRQQNHYGNTGSTSYNDSAFSYYHSLRCGTNILYINLYQRCYRLMPYHRHIQCLYLLGSTSCMRGNDNRNMDGNGCLRKNNSFSIQRYHRYPCTTGSIYHTTS